MVEIEQDWIEAAEASDAATGIPASVTIAQFVLESGWGAHMPGNNPFGIKAVGDQPSQALETHEAGIVHPILQNFRVFPTLADAFTAHAQLLATGVPYQAACLQLPDVAKFVRAMAPRYATDPLYANKILAIIAAHDLTQYDAIPTVVTA